MFNKSEAKDECFKGHSIFGKTKRSCMVKSSENLTDEKNIMESALSYSYSNINKSFDEEMDQYLLNNSINEISSEESRRMSYWYNDNHY